MWQGSLNGRTLLLLAIRDKHPGQGVILVLDEAAIIPFKARAWLDLTDQREVGEKIDEKNIRKHRNDVARLLQLLSRDAPYALPDIVAADLRSFGKGDSRDRS